MGIADVTRPAVFAVIAEHDRIGHDNFLKKYGYGHARSYLLLHEGKSYDATAILGAAHGYLEGREPLQAQEFSGREQTVARKAKTLGFDVTSSRLPVWVRDEVILACDLVRQNNWRSLSSKDPRIHELSELLQLLPLHPPEVRGPKFRNPNGVARKTADIATRHPDYTGKPTKGGAIDREVLQDFLERPDEMRAAAAAIREGVEHGLFEEVAYEPVVEAVDEPVVTEGRLLEKRHLARERDPKLRKRKIADFLKTHDRLACEVCGFDFGKVYGDRGEGYIECHHVVPLHASGETTTRLKDLVLLCSNCHRMIHRTSPWLTPDELRGLVGRQTALTAGAGRGRT